MRLIAVLLAKGVGQRAHAHCTHTSTVENSLDPDDGSQFSGASDGRDGAEGPLKPCLLPRPSRLKLVGALDNQTLGAGLSRIHVHQAMLDQRKEDVEG